MGLARELIAYTRERKKWWLVPLIVVMVLVRFGVVSLERLKDARPYVIVGSFVVAAIITPPDVLSQFLLAVPMCLLYEAGLFFARFVGKRAEEAKAAEQ